MYLTMGLVLALVSTMIEVLLVHGAPWIDRIYTTGVHLRFFKWRWHIRGIWFNTAGSFILSALIGAMFSADGVTVLFGSMVSTALSQAWFSTEKFCRSLGWTWPGFKANVRGKVLTLQRTKDNVVRVYHDFQRPVQDCMRFALFVLRAVTYPFVLARKASAAYTAKRT